MALLITDVLDFLVAEGLIGGATGWAQAAGYIPPEGDKVIAVFETAGLVPEVVKAGSDEQAYDDPGFQIRGRGAEFGYDELRQKMGAVYRSLHGSTLGPTTGDPAYVFVYGVQSGPLPLGLDDKSFPHLTWNFIAMRERESS